MTEALAAELNAAVREGSLAEVKLSIHPYVRWVDLDGADRAGRSTLLARLEEAGPVVGPPFELRDGQLYRCTLATLPHSCSA